MARTAVIVGPGVTAWECRAGVDGTRAGTAAVGLRLRPSGLHLPVGARRTKLPNPKNPS